MSRQLNLYNEEDVRYIADVLVSECLENTFGDTRVINISTGENVCIVTFLCDKLKDLTISVFNPDDSNDVNDIKFCNQLKLEIVYTGSAKHITFTLVPEIHYFYSYNIHIKYDTVYKKYITYVNIRNSQNRCMIQLNNYNIYKIYNKMFKIFEYLYDDLHITDYLDINRLLALYKTIYNYSDREKHKYFCFDKTVTYTPEYKQVVYNKSQYCKYNMSINYSKKFNKVSFVSYELNNNLAFVFVYTNDGIKLTELISCNPPLRFDAQLLDIFNKLNIDYSLFKNKLH